MRAVVIDEAYIVLFDSRAKAPPARRSEKGYGAMLEDEVFR